MSMFELRRECKNIDVCVFKGSEDECIAWVNEAIVRNGWEPLVLTDVYMRPVWDNGQTAFYLKKIGH